MSNRTDFNALAIELIEMFRLDADTESDIGDTLLWRLKRELHNAFVAGQQGTKPDPSDAPQRLLLPEESGPIELAIHLAAEVGRSPISYEERDRLVEALARVTTP